MNLNFRTIGKICFLLLIIGFFMPMGCNQNGFQLADSGMLDSLGIFVIYGSFFASIVGVIIGILLLFKKGIPVVIDWVIVLFCFIAIVATYYNIGFNQGYRNNFQSGVYMVLIGSILTLLFQIVSTVKKEH